MKKEAGNQNAINLRDFLKNTAIACAAFMIVPRFVFGGKGYTAPGNIINLGFVGTGKQVAA